MESNDGRSNSEDAGMQTPEAMGTVTATTTAPGKRSPVI